MTSRTPVIGVTRCSSLDDYVASIEQTGARVRVLEISDSPRRVSAEIAGLLLTGGGDVDPALYGDVRHPATEDAEPGRDEFEIDLACRAMAADLPVLAICRGIQVLNVAAGGTLVQDIPSQIPDARPHSVPEPKDLACHDVRIARASALHQLLGRPAGGTDRCRVNSRHHQAVGRPGAGLAVSATAPDGVIEALERPGARFCIGIQWHPENFWRTGQFRPLFETFAAAARSGTTQAPGHDG